MTEQATFIPFDQMKEQLQKELLSLNLPPGAEGFHPVISYEKGVTRITWPLKSFHLDDIYHIIRIINQYIDNLRVVSFEDGHYGFQAMNKNMFKTDNMLDNIKYDLFHLVSPRFEISRKGDLAQDEIGSVIALLKHTLTDGNSDPASRLRAMGASVIEDSGDLGWEYIAGYEEVKRTIRESIILPLQNPDVFDSVAKLTRNVFESNRPRALLFEGPPGVGKTTVARIIAGEVDVPLVYVPVESIMSKWYGQSSQNLAEIFDACDDMGGALIFLDEIDSLAGSRDGGLFEATRRVLSVLLRKLDGLDAVESTITIGATNRRDDLDNALLNRFDQTITFPLPGAEERTAIFIRYAKHLTKEDASVLGEESTGLSGRTIKDICEMAERRWARRLIIKKEEPSPPPLDYYRKALRSVS